jgi:Domain of unknown function (DUF4349)
MAAISDLFQRRNIFLGLSIFAGLLLIRLAYGYLVTASSDSDGFIQSDIWGGLSSPRKNYASEKIKGGDVMAAAQTASAQKFEKTATIGSKSNDFERDGSQLRQLIQQYNGVVQYEQNQGQTGHRELHQVIGIAPERFDTFTQRIQLIGQLKHLQVIKVDKTNEYRQLNAKKVSLEKSLASLNEFKSKGGSISDYIQLHEKIVEVEEKMQELGVELGNFDTENEFCTVRFSLLEQPVKNISFAHRLKVATQWAGTYGLYLLGILLFLQVIRLFMGRGKSDK